MRVKKITRLKYANEAKKLREQGMTLDEIRRTIKRRFKQNFSTSTIHNWTAVPSIEALEAK